MSEFQFISTHNYLKRHPSSGMTALGGPNVSKYFGSLYIRQLVIPHNLGFAPFFRVFYEPYRDGRIMEAFQDNAWFLPSSPNEERVSAVAPTCMAWADDENLYIELNYIDSTLSANSYNVYYVIYAGEGVSS